MANYSLVINSQFKPFSYQELLQPALMATQAHQAVEEAYADLSTKASIWDKMANEATDKKAHSIYKRYAEDLQAQSEQLAQYGLTPASRQAMLQMRNRYAQDIIPIENAYKRREADIAAQKEAMLKDPTHFFNRRAREVSLDEYMDNQNLDVLSENYSGALLTKQVSDAAAALKQTLMKRGKLTGAGLPYQYERMLQYGATADEVFDAMSRDPKALPILTKLVEDTIEASGIRNWSSMGDDWKNNQIYKNAEAYAMKGLLSAIGTTKYETLKDDAGLTKFQYDLMDRNAANKEARERAAKAREAENQLAGNIALSGESYIVSSGKDKEYMKALEGLRGGQQGIKASLFGKDGKSNALKVYDEYRKAGKSNLTAAEISALEKEADKRATAKWEEQWGEDIHVNQQKIAADQLNTYIQQERNKAILNASRQKVLKKYGVSQVLTPEQYDALKAIGYNGEQLTSMSQLVTGINNLSKQKTYYSTNMSNYDIPDLKIRSALSNWEANGSFAGRVYKLNTDGTRGEDMTFSDLNLKSDENDKGRKITGIYYSDVTPDKIIIQVGDGTGERYLVDPNALGTDVNSFIDNARANLKGVGSTERAQTITIGLAKMLNSYNPTASTTSPKIQ